MSENEDLNSQVARKLGWTEEAIRLHTSIPDYCGSIEAAWEIVEHLRSGLQVGFGLFFIAEPNGLWTCRLSHETTLYAIDKNWIIEESADTAPLAIVAAFLKAGERGSKRL